MGQQNTAGKGLRCNAHGAMLTEFTSSLAAPSPADRTASVQSPLGAPAAANPAAARPGQAVTAAASTVPKQVPTGSPVTASGRRFVSYCVQKLSSGKANHAAFWIQDAAGESLLAVVVSWGGGCVWVLRGLLGGWLPTGGTSFPCSCGPNCTCPALRQPLICRAPTPGFRATSLTPPPQPSWSCAWRPRCAAPTARRCR